MALFLHADTRLDEGWQSAVGVFMAGSANRARAAVFDSRSTIHRRRHGAWKDWSTGVAGRLGCPMAIRVADRAILLQISRLFQAYTADGRRRYRPPHR